MNVAAGKLADGKILVVENTFLYYICLAGCHGEGG